MILYSANLQHGTGTDGELDFARQVEAMADADIICVQERTAAETGWNAPLASAGLTESVLHQHLGAGNCTAIWTRPATITVLQTYTVNLAPTGGSAILGWDGVDIRRGACAAKVRHKGRQFYVVSVHLVAASGEDNSNTNFAAQRVTQIESLGSWMSSTLTGGLPRLLAGDFNLPPNYPRATERSYTADASTDTITSTGHGFTDGTAVALRNDGGAQPSPLAVGSSLYALATVYYIRDVDTNTFRLASSPGGPLIDLTTNGTGSNFVSATQWDLLRAAHYDLWQEGLSSGKASVNWGDRDGGGTPDMPLDFYLTRTHDTRRIDYIWLDRASKGITLREITVPDLRETCPHGLVNGACTPEVTSTTGTPDDAGVKPSDHNFVRVDLNIGPAPVKATQFSWMPHIRL